MSDGEILVVQPGEGESHWQPVPANGHIEVLVAPDRVGMEQKFAFGTQSVAPGGHVREHAHDRNEELIHVLSGSGRAVLDGEIGIDASGQHVLHRPQSPAHVRQ